MARGKALVTGGAGFIGSHVVRELLAREWDVTVYDNLSVGRRETVPADARLIVGDVRDEAQVTQATQGMDAVFHLAAVVSVRASIEQFYSDADINVMGTLNILRGAAMSGVGRVVYASSMAVYADSPDATPVPESHPTRPLSPYGISKLTGESYTLMMAQSCGFESVALRYFNTYGPGQTFTPYVGVITIFARRLLAGEHPVILGDGQQQRDFVHVNDIARATVGALEAPSGVVCNVGTGRATTVTALAELLTSRINPALAPEYAPAHPGELRNSIADISAAQRFLGYQPQHELVRDIDAVIEWNREMAAKGARQ